MHIYTIYTRLDLILGNYVNPPHDRIQYIQYITEPKACASTRPDLAPNLQVHDRDLCLRTRNLPTSHSVHHSLHHRIPAASYTFKHQSNRCRIIYNKMTTRVTLVNTLTAISQFRHMSSNYFIVHYGEYVQVIQIHSRNIL
jgi:outer membrane protein assembly factor BamD (BamD/ComL family)